MPGEKGEAMKKGFRFTLKGGDWWRQFLIYWVIFVVLEILIDSVRRWAPEGVVHPAGRSLILLVLNVVLIIVEAAFTIVAFRIVLPKVEVDGKGFEFYGSIGKYIGINLGGFLLTIVTLTIYAPWYARRVAAYLVSETRFDGETPQFLGKAGKLLVYFLLGVWVPVLAIGAVAGLVYGFGPHHDVPESMGEFTAIVVPILFVVLIPFLYLGYRWYVNFRWKETFVRWQTRFWPSCGFLLGQIALTVITVGIYWPAATLRVYRYFLGKTALLASGHEIGRLGFDGSIGKGFGLMWGQTLLSIITLGVYIPWAFAKVGAWVLGASSYQQPDLAP